MITYAEEVDNENLNISTNSQPEQILNIKTNLLRPTEKLQLGNRLLDDSTNNFFNTHNFLVKYERASGSGVFEAIPSIIKFEGFEINKKLKIKLLLVNKSKFSQRISIIPPTTPFFKIKFTKRGLIAPGLSEIVYVTFIPQNYQYYYDYIRVICEGDKIMVPIHAYPKMNIHMKDYLPRFIDFGTVAINSKGLKEINLRNIITLPFEFEFVPIKSCEEIKVEPLYGEVEAVSNKSLIFTFSPESYGLFISEYEFKLSEFEFKPLLITITGNCNIFEKVLNENILIHMKKQREKKNVLKKLDEINTTQKSYNILNNPKTPSMNHKKFTDADTNSYKNFRNKNEDVSFNKANNEHNQSSNILNLNVSNENNTGNILKKTDITNEHQSNQHNPSKIIIKEENEDIKNSENPLHTNDFNNSKQISRKDLSPEIQKNPFEYNSPVSSNRFKESNAFSKIDHKEDYHLGIGNNQTLHDSSFHEYKENNEQVQNTLMNNNSRIEKGLAKKFKAFPTTKERDYLQYYNQIETIIKDKEIKYLKFIGKKLLNEVQINKIISDRIKEFEYNLMIKKNLDLNRFKFEFDTAKSTVDRLNKYYIKPTFNFNLNDKFFKTRSYYKIFLKAMTKVIIRRRAEKNLTKIKNLFVNQNIKNSKDFSDYTEKDLVDILNKDEETQESKMKIKFVKPKIIVRSPTYLCYDYNLESLKQEMGHENNINLDELYQYNKLDISEVEIIGYKEFKSNGLTLYEVSTSDKVLRSGAEFENPIRGERGDSEQVTEKIFSLLEMPKTYGNHLETKLDSLLFNNPSLKKYCQYPEYTESALDYNLQPRIIDTSDYLKNVFSAGFNYQNDIYNKLPLTIYENIQLRELEKNLICDSTIDFMPKKIECADQKELFIKNGEIIDEDNYINEMPREDELKVLENLEKDDEVIQKLKEINKDDVNDLKEKEKINLETYLQSQKRKWVATLPTVLEYYNSGMTYPNNKFIL